MESERFERALAENKELQKKLNAATWDNVALRIRIQGTEDACKVLRSQVDRRDREIAELQAALVNAGKKNEELKDKLSISDFWQNACRNLREELTRVEKNCVGLQKKYDDAVSIGLGYMNQCEKAQGEVESLKGGIAAYRTANGNLYNEINKLKDVVVKVEENNATLTDDLQLAKARLEYSNGLVDKMGKEKQYLLDQLTGDEKKIAGLQETVGRYAAECSKLNFELTKAQNELTALKWYKPYEITITASGTTFGSLNCK